MTIQTSKRELIVDWFRTRLQLITTANGYATNAGALVLFGTTPELAPEDAGGPETAIAVIVGNDNPVWQGASLMIRMPFVIHALATAQISQPWKAIEAILGDIKRAVEVEDRTIGGLVPREIERGTTNTVEHPADSMTVGVSIEYIVPYTEVWGAPEA